MKKLQDRVAIITGGASGIGFATAKLFLSEGAKVSFLDISEKGGRKAVEKLGSKGRVMFVQGDVSKEADVKRFISNTLAKFGRIDILFNNAGVLGAGTVEEISSEQWDRVIAINLRGTFLCSKYAIPVFKKQGRGVIVNNASCNAIIADYGVPAYCASKGGIGLLTRALAADYAKQNIRVNAVCFGEIETPMAMQESKNFNMTMDEFRKMCGSAHPINRLGTPEEAAKAVLFLASDDSTFMTGALMSVDGGLTATCPPIH